MVGRISCTARSRLNVYAIMAMAIVALLSCPMISADADDGSSACDCQSKTLLQPITLRRIRWIHFPKAGTSFANTIVHYCCPKVPKDAVLPTRITGKQLEPFFKEYPYNSYCTRNCLLPPRSDAHRPVGLALRNAKDINLVGMFRDPRRMMWSAYNFYKQTGVKDRSLLRGITNPKEFIEQKASQGCMTKMLLGFQCWKSMDISQEMVETAVDIVQTRFAYIGITDEWNLSICLFHKMFGEELLPIELKNTRRTDGYDQDEALKVFKPEDNPADWEVYQAAKAIFDENIKAYGVSCGRASSSSMSPQN